MRWWRKYDRFNEDDFVEAPRPKTKMVLEFWDWRTHNKVFAEVEESVFSDPHPGDTFTCKVVKVTREVVEE